MRRQEKEIKDKKAIDFILKNSEYGVLSVLAEEHQPYGIPLNYVYFDNRIFFHCALEGRKVEAIRDNDKVSFCIVGQSKVIPSKFSTEYESVIIEGRASEVGIAYKKKALEELVRKYSPEYLDNGLAYIDRAAAKTNVVMIEIERMTGKGNIEK